MKILRLLRRAAWEHANRSTRVRFGMMNRHATLRLTQHDKTFLEIRIQPVVHKRARAYTETRASPHRGVYFVGACKQNEDAEKVGAEILDGGAIPFRLRTVQAIQNCAWLLRV